MESVSDLAGDGVEYEIFRTTFASIPDVSRMTDWLSSKWAPAVLRTYDLAGIRIGDRPVSSRRVDDKSDENRGTMEIVWQKLVDFNSVTVGRMIVEVDGNSVRARRGGGDARMGFGTVSLEPLAGEDVLVRRLADAASQAVEKGLAKKVCFWARARVQEREIERVSGRRGGLTFFRFMTRFV